MSNIIPLQQIKAKLISLISTIQIGEINRGKLANEGACGEKNKKALAHIQ